MCSENTQGMFEIHLAGPKVDLDLTQRVFEKLNEVGLTKNKFFLAVYNVPPPGLYDQVACTPPTGHDLDNPGWMTTIKVSDFEQAREYVLKGMGVLKEFDIKGNFEIERVIAQDVPDYFIDIDKEFPEYQRVPDSPNYENHIIWKDKKMELPSNETICEVIQKRFGILPHQIVDFSSDSKGSTLVSRVATIYQPSREEAIRFGSRESDKHLVSHSYIVTEQVCLVGEPKRLNTTKKSLLT